MRAKSVLIVEDESIVALDLKFKLEDLGYAISGIADSADAAQQQVERSAPSLILMDVRLKGCGDGIEAAAAIRRRHDIPIMFLTSHSDDETVQRAARTGAYGFVTKPFQLRDLRAGIEVALAKSDIERQLREADQWFAHTLRCVADGVIVTDTDLRIRFVNPAAERLTGWADGEALGREIGHVVCCKFDDGATPSSEPAAALVRQVLQAEPAASVERTLRLVSAEPAGSVVDATAGPVDDERGVRLGAVLVLRDATGRLAQEAFGEERKRREVSELANAAKTDFLSRVSHEMRTPLNAVMGFAQLLEAQPELDAQKTRHYARHIHTAGGHLLSLVTDLLDLNRIAQGQLKINVQRLQLSAVVDETLDMLSSLARDHGIELDTTVAGDLVVLADHLRLRQVLLNLGSNAIKYNRHGGSVSLRAKRLATGPIRIEVRDNGIGMTAEQQQQLFEPFERLGHETSKTPGVGLGLVIVRGLVHQMGGTLALASAARQGTTVTIELPAAP